MPSRRIIIGDVHGQYDPLLQLIEAIAPQEKEPVYFLGDLIDRGPNSAQVVEFVRQHRYRCLLGNHEQQDATHFCWIRDEFHSIPEPFFSDKLIITGHTITFTFPGVNPGQLVAGAGWLDIDTGAYHSHSNWLTGLDITNRLVYQVNTKDKTLRKFDLEDITTSINPTEVYTKRMQPTP